MKAGQLLMRIRLHIRELAEERGISKTKLSYKAELNYTTVSDLWKDEVKNVQLVTLLKVARVLGVAVTDLYTAIDDENE